MELVINKGVSLSSESENFVMTDALGTQQLPAAEITLIQVYSGSLVMSDAVILAVENGIEIVFNDQSNQPMARVWSPIQLSDTRCKDDKSATEEKSSDDVISMIRQTLNLQYSNPDVYVPQEITDILDDLCAFIEERGIVITEMKSIQYGMKFHFRIGVRQAETNLFYGKRGFNVVQAARKGTDRECNELMAEAINSFLADKRHNSLVNFFDI